MELFFHSEQGEQREIFSLRIFFCWVFLLLFSFRTELILLFSLLVYSEHWELRIAPWSSIWE